jgi:hypothetical protein
VPAGHLHRPTPSGLPHLVAEVRPRLGRRYRAPRAGQQLLPAVQMLDQTAQGDRQQPPRARPRRRWSPERPPACARRGRRPGRRAARSDRPHRPVEPRLARRISFCTDLRGTLPAAVRTAGRQQVKATIRTRLDRDPPSGLASVMKAASLGRGPRPSDAHEHDRRSPRQRVQVPSGKPARWCPRYRAPMPTRRARGYGRCRSSPGRPNRGRTQHCRRGSRRSSWSSTRPAARCANWPSSPTSPSPQSEHPHPGAASTAAELARWRCRSLATEASRGGHERGWPVASEPPACRYET